MKLLDLVFGFLDKNEKAINVLLMIAILVGIFYALTHFADTWKWLLGWVEE